jgi:hypothetical protein
VKTPREILLHRHAPTTPKLDQIRARVLQREFSPARESNSRPQSLLALLWRELFEPARGVWTGCAAAWLVILIFNFEARDSTRLSTGVPRPSSAQSFSAFAQQRRLVAELMEDGRETPLAPPKNSGHRPRSDRQAANKAG